MPGFWLFKDSNIFLVSPTKLTLAPVASEMVLDLMASRGIKPAHDSWAGLPTHLTSGELMIGHEKWSLRPSPLEIFDEVIPW